ncbi:HpcH/HpaI aldolase family protein [Litoreibacter albidus]|uniref:2-keto-3-deoxy-L-rhamnonate aldolase RhmA n=1 Tax=Litoreibacter albidus TaxID=670155 RepID=A0A1H2SGS1_9RHOB|nr:aldolase/citrate lyase family protein [Litoreibacter albidus]SDW30841.1 2-keto-3-deoxy-L-rhamnonate aldolase RhmA [Litoreibacter albidus]
MTVNSDFKAKLVAKEPLLGTFIKTPHPIIIEIMAHAGFDFLVIDAEHAPFDRTTIDMMLIAARAEGCPIIVRVPTSSPDWVLNILDAGAAGIMVPHVETAAQAQALAQSVTYGPGGRGFAGTSRAAEYARRPLAEHLARARDEVSLICQIEDPDGVINHAEIAAVDGVDALFIGRADLAVSHGYSDFFAPEVADMTTEILGNTDTATGLYCPPTEELGPLQAVGGSLFVVGSEHSLMTSGGLSLSQKFNAVRSAKETLK